MEYKHFGYDFIERTTELIKSTTSIHEKYDVTYLLNCCFGLITIPRETMIKQIPKIDLKTAQFGGINVEKISKSLRWDKSTQKYVDDYSLSNVLKHLRNGISHGKIEQASISKGQIESIRIIDKYKDEVNFEIELSPIELKCFVLELSKALLSTKPT